MDEQRGRGEDPRGGAGPMVTIPPGAPESARAFQVRAEGESSPFVMAFHIVLATVAALLMVHSAFYVLLFL